MTQGPGALTNANYTVVEYAQNAFSLSEGASGTLDHATLRHNQNGLWVSGGLATHDPTQDPTQDSRPVMHHSNLYDNSNCHYSATDFADVTVTLDAQTNWWGTTDAARIERDIYDRQDDANSPVIDWQTAQKAITVTSTATTPITVAADRYTGLIPLTVNLTINNPSNISLAHVSVDFDTDGTLEIDTADLTTPLSHSYDTQGDAVVTVSITDVEGRVHVNKLAILAEESPEQVVATLTAVWNSLLDKLMQGNITGALTHLNTNVQTKYEAVFNSIPDLAATVADMEKAYLAPSTLDDDNAEFLLIRNEGGNYYGYPVLFTRRGDGAWLIEGM